MGASETKHITVTLNLGAPSAHAGPRSVVVAIGPAGAIAVARPTAPETPSKEAEAPPGNPNGSSAVESLSEIVRLLASRVSVLEAMAASDPQTAAPATS
jgi:hypothetical protein